MHSPRTVCIAVNYSRSSSLLLESAISHLHSSDQIILIHVRPYMTQIATTNGQLNTLLLLDRIQHIKSHELLKEHAHTLKKHGFKVRCVIVHGQDIAQQICSKAASIGCDCILIGTHEKEKASFLKRLLEKPSMAKLCRRNSRKDVKIMAVKLP